MIKTGPSCAVWPLPWLMISRIQMHQLTSTTQSKMSMIFFHGLHHCSCEFYQPFKRRDSWQGDQDNKKIWKTRTIPFPKDKNPLDEWRHGAVHLSSLPWLGVLERRVLAIPATSTAHERLFSTAGNVMTKKRSRLTCDNMEELVYLHDVGRRCGDGRRSRRFLSLGKGTVQVFHIFF